MSKENYNANIIEDSELFIGIIKTVGTDVKTVIDSIIDFLKKFKYETEVISVSKLILSRFCKNKQDFLTEFERISFYMDLGNELRERTEDSSVLMKGVSAYIYENNRQPNGDAPIARKAYIIDSIKHPDEVNFLRKTYGDGFHLIGISSDYEERIKYLKERKDFNTDQINKILSRDEDEDEINGQHTRDAYQQSDYFIDVSDVTTIDANVSRLLDLLFGNSFITPTFEEYAMFRAYVASLRSADLSRQIGSVITKNNEIIAEGVNDCPKFGGGLYWSKYEGGYYKDKDGGRDYKLGYDSNKIEQKKIIDRILEVLGIEKTDENVNKVKLSGIGLLTEYGRVVHSEMEALLMCSRNNITTVGCEMYVTTFPCHNCAKHIIASGIVKVVYIEPYPKSKALEFYNKEITQSKKEHQNNPEKVLFTSFNGVGPHRFIDLFSMQSIKWYDRKRKDSSGYALEWKREDANLRNPMALLNYIDMEKSAYKQYQEEIKKFRKENN